MMTSEAMEVQASGAGEGLAGPTRSYVCPARDQLFLMPVSMRDWLDEGHLAWFVIDVVSELETAAVHRRPGGCPGRPPYDPEMMLALLLYAYCCGIRSSRRIEAQCETDAAFRVICGGLVPDHATIARFVVDHEQALEGLFVEGLRLGAAAGLTDLSVVALDGTKIAADAALARNRDGEWIRGEVAKLMALTSEPAGEAGVDRLVGGEPVAEISSRSGRLARLQAALEVIEVDHQVAADRLASMQAARAAKLAAAARGETLAAPPPCPIEQAQGVLARAQTTLAAARDAIHDAAPRLVGRTSPIPTAGS